MNIHEYQAKFLLKEIGIPIPYGKVAASQAEIDDILSTLEAKSYVVKAQIHAGGRGKAQGIKIVTSKQEAKIAAYNLLNTRLVTAQTTAIGQLVERIYIESACNYLKEYYLCLKIDKVRAAIAIIVSKQGGMEIENTFLQNPAAIYSIYVGLAQQLPDFQIRKLAYFLKFTDKIQKQFSDIIQKLYQFLIRYDVLQLEINPLVVTDAGDLMVLDAKLIFDDYALGRQPQIIALLDGSQADKSEMQAIDLGMRYVKLEGQIGCMVNGAGLAMATMDLINLHGISPANFLDIGGSITQHKVKEALKIILSDSKVSVILVNIFGGIVRCDIIAEAIVAVAQEQTNIVPLVIRMIGTYADLGRQTLIASGLDFVIVDTLDEAVTKAIQFANKI